MVTELRSGVCWFQVREGRLLLVFGWFFLPCFPFSGGSF